jgi:hypothetical protein
MQGMLLKALKDDEKKECIIRDRNLKGKRIEKNVIKKLDNKKKTDKGKVKKVSGLVIIIHKQINTKS